MYEDEQGFLYPKVDLSLCIDCHLCEKVCPVINQAEPRQPLQTYAAKNKNKDAEIRRKSSSGGIFYALAEAIIKEGGVVFGARFNYNWEVVHGYAETLEGVRAFQGSKYVQSRIGLSFLEAEQFLKSGRKVMFTGTPCQTAGLKYFLRKDYSSQLLLVDTACHGVPSPLIWDSFLHSIAKESGFSMKSIININFRDKRNGWERYGMVISFASRDIKHSWYCPMQDNLFMQGFLKDLYLRPSCYDCPAKCGKSHSDLTLADFWGISTTQPEDYDPAGVSLVLANTPVGLATLQKVDGSLQISPASYEAALRGNPSIEHPACRTRWVDEFWHLYPESGLAAISPLIRKAGPSFPCRILTHCKRLGRQILGDKCTDIIKSLIRK